MSTRVRFWVDPICPWCWVTSQWIREIAVERDLDIVWEPISLLIKNEPAPDSAFYEPLQWTYGLLRIMESVRASDGEAAVGALYVEYGRRIHHDGERLWDPALALEAVGLDAKHAQAATDEQWDAPLRERMAEGLALVGADVGTPIIALETADGREVAAFGPVITKVPTRESALKLWDAFVTVTELEEFWEIKRTRTRGPEFGDRP
jgi:protein-disulfide isomerase-like protein with CxxC motif